MAIPENMRIPIKNTRMVIGLRNAKRTIFQVIELSE
jgi:hypothetical protein